MNTFETFEVDGSTRVVLTDDHRIAVHGERDSVSALVYVRDTEALRRALFAASLVQSEQIAKAKREARASEPIDDVTRKAIFAALRDVYQRELDRDERLEVLTKLAGRKVWSIGRRGNMTMADARRVLDILGTLRDAP